MGAINITNNALIIKPSSSTKPIILANNQVVEIKSYSTFFNRDIIIVDHTAFNTWGDIIFTVIGMTASQFLLSVQAEGFIASGSSAIPWDPANGHPGIK